MNWDLYNAQLTVKGSTRRERSIFETQRSINKRIVDSVAYKDVIIDGIPQQLSIVSGSKKCHKKIAAMPNECIYAGSIVEWNNAHFLITETDVEDEIYQSGDMYRCNVYLKWQNEKGEVITRYGYSSNSGRSAAGITDRDEMMELNQVFVVDLPCDEETVKIRRDKRFLIDVITDEPNAYIVTGRNVITGNWTVDDLSNAEFDKRDKVLTLFLSQTQLSEKDNCELMIADYFDPEESVLPPTPVGSCSITYSGEPVVKAGGSNKKFSAEFKDASGNVVNITPAWSVTTLPEYEKNVTVTTEGNWIKLRIKNDLDMIGSQILLQVTDGEGLYQSELYVKVVSLYG